MLKFLISIFLAWLLYKLVFNLIIPGYRVTKEVRRQMNSMQDHMRQQYEQQQGAYGQQQPKQDPPKQEKPKDRGEYLDFEEIK